jgi:hypothetical protein
LSDAGTENGLPQRSAKKISIYVHASSSKCRTKSYHRDGNISFENVAKLKYLRMAETYQNYIN